jgi:hypothetical protein
MSQNVVGQRYCAATQLRAGIRSGDPKRPDQNEMWPAGFRF